MHVIGLKETIASIDVDTQNGFTSLCPLELPVPFGEEVVDELNQQATFAKFRIGTKDAHPANADWVGSEYEPDFSQIIGASNMDMRWPVHCVPGTKGFELIKGLPHVSQYDFFVYKGVEPDMHPYGGCYHDFAERVSTGLIEFLRSKGVKTVIVGGLATDYCVKETVLQLLAAGFATIVNLGACRGLTKETTEQAITLMQQQGAIMIQSSVELVQTGTASQAIHG
ncbi:MAG: nicotinamidase [Candidatus Berkiella sp.]